MDYKFIVQYGEYREVPGYCQHPSIPDNLLWPGNNNPIDILGISLTSKTINEIKNSSHLSDYQLLFLTKPGNPWRSWRIDPGTGCGVEIVTGRDGHWLVESRDGRIYGTWTGYNEVIPDRYNREPWAEVIRRHHTRTFQPKSYRPLREAGMFGLIDMIQYIESASTIPIREMVGAEIGTYQGAAADCFASKFRWLYTIDPWMRNGHEMTDVKAVYEETMSLHGNTVHYQETGMDAASRFEDGSLDFVYIDACHDYDSVVADVLTWRPKLKPDAFLCGHDFPGRKGDVERALIDTVGLPDAIFTDKSWVIKFKGGSRG